MRIYVAGPYTTGDVAVNVRNAVYTGNILALRGHAVFIPHLTHFWHMLIPHSYDFWMEQDMQWLEVCDAVLRIEGESAGADREVEYAIAHGKPVYTNVFDVPEAKQ